MRKKIKKISYKNIRVGSYAPSNKTRTSLNSRYYRFLRIIRNKSNFLVLKKLPTVDFLTYLLLERSRLAHGFNLILRDFFLWRFKLLHNKISYFWKMKFLWYFNEQYFPEITSRWLMKKLFWYKRKRFLRSKMWKINYYFMKKLVYNFRKGSKKWHTYYLARDAYFSLVDLSNHDIYRFRRRGLGLFSRSKNLMRQRAIKFIFKKAYWKLKLFKHRISFKLSWSLRWAVISSTVSRRIVKFRKRFVSLMFKTDSFKKIFKFEFYVPFQSLFFWKSILWFTNTKYFLLPAKKLLLSNFEVISNLILTWLRNLGYKWENFVGILARLKNFSLHGYDFFNTKRLEKIILPIVRYFSFFKKSFLLPIAINYIDFLFLKWKFLPPQIVKLLSSLLEQLFKDGSTTIDKSEDTEYDKLLTLFFYKFINEIFELVFSFSPGNIFFFKSKKWRQLFNSWYLHLSMKGWNWDYLKFFSWKIAYVKWKSEHRLPFYRPHYTVFPKHFYEFYFFIWRKNYRIKKLKLRWFSKKWKVFDLTKYLAKLYFPTNFIWSQIFWRVFFIRPEVKQAWFNTQINYGRVKIIYDSYMYSQNRFWSKFYFWKTSFERLLLYGFAYWSGMLDFNLDWNFLVGYRGTLAFKLKKKKNIKINRKNFNTEKVNQGFLGEMWYNSLFFSFFTFLSWSFMLRYYLQFGHIKANYNTSYKDYLVMIYNDWFILNILNVQLNLWWNLWVMFKMFYLAGFVCLVAPFNILLEALVGIYGSFGDQPYTRYVWINGLFSNFDKIFLSIQTTIANAYAGWIFFSWKMVWKLIWLWFSMRGLLQNLSIDISFFPSLYKSSWVFLESCARFYPTITTSNTECFLPTAYLEYSTVSNDFSLLSLCLYVNLLIVMFKWSKLTRQAEFSVYPQKLISMAMEWKILPVAINIKHYHIQWQMRVVMSFIWYSWAAIFDFSKADLTNIYKYYFIYRKYSLDLVWKQNFWRFLFFKPRKPIFSKFF